MKGPASAGNSGARSMFDRPRLEGALMMSDPSIASTGSAVSVELGWETFGSSSSVCRRVRSNEDSSIGSCIQISAHVSRRPK